MAVIGKPIDRIDGRLKVTGKATYAAEFPMANLAYGFPLQSTIAAGEIVSIDVSEAEKSAGVLKIITHQNALKLAPRPATTYANLQTRASPVLQDTRINCYGQYIGLIVAETYEQARHAANLVKISYNAERPKIDFDENAAATYKPATINGDRPTDTSWGNLENGLKQAAEIVAETYETPIKHHHPLEPHATVAAFQGANLIVHESTQQLVETREAIANTFGLPKENIQVLSPYIGGGFGSKLMAGEHLMLTVMAAKILNRPIKTAITRQMMQTNVGLRQINRQKMRLGASRDEKLTAIAHEIVTHTSVDEEFVEQTGVMTRIMYDAPNSLVTHRVFPLHVQAPHWTRAPGEAPGSFALESAMDELAYKLQLDRAVRQERQVTPAQLMPYAKK